MTDDGPAALDRSRGVRLELADYRRDFRRRDEAITGRHSWKFERRQSFEEQASPSWDAFRRGEWEESLRLAREGREHWEKTVSEDEARGNVFHRVRVVEEHLTPYMQWELNVLLVQSESGVPVRVVGGERLRRLESAAPLPEVVVLGGEVLYEVVYTDDGHLDGGVRHTAPEAIASWERFIASLYEAGEEIVSYVDRRVSHLPAPMTSR